MTLGVDSFAFLWRLDLHYSVEPQSLHRHVALDLPPHLRLKQILLWVLQRECEEVKKSQTSESEKGTSPLFFFLFLLLLFLLLLLLFLILIFTFLNPCPFLWFYSVSAMCSELIASLKNDSISTSWENTVSDLSFLPFLFSPCQFPFISESACLCFFH